MAPGVNDASPFHVAIELERDAGRPVTRVFRHVLLISQFFERVIEESAARFGLQRGEFLVLMTLNRANGDALRPTELYRSLLVSAGAVTKQTGRLEARGLIERVPCPDDGRSQMIRLTAEGQRITDGIRAAPNAMNEVADSFGIDRLEALDELLREYLEAMARAGHGFA